jgi:CheY-like chemotaxis protein
VVVVDINMPGLCGDRLVELFRKQPKLRDIGIVLVSGMPVSELQVIRERCGADAEVSKSQLAEKLPDAITEAYARREARLGRPRPGKSA